MNKTIVLLAVLLLLGCTQRIVDIKNGYHIGKSVHVSGTAENTIKIGSLSGFSLHQDNESILVSSGTLPEEGDSVSVSGVLIKDTIFGYYIKADSVR
jgi:hypothetical protein